jgi:hypothetical protein
MSLFLLLTLIRCANLSSGRELYNTRLALADASAAANLTIRDLQLQLEDAGKRRKHKVHSRLERDRDRSGATPVALPRVPTAVVSLEESSTPSAVIEIAPVAEIGAADPDAVARNTQMLEKGRSKRKTLLRKKKKKHPADGAPVDAKVRTLAAFQ